MPPGVVATPSDTPADFSRPSPTPEDGHDLAFGSVHTPPEAAFRYLVKLSVVPDSSERKNTWISSAGSVAPSLTAAIAAPSHVAISPRKILAVVAASSTSSSTPSRL